MSSVSNDKVHQGRDSGPKAWLFNVFSAAKGGLFNNSMANTKGMPCISFREIWVPDHIMSHA